MMNIAQPSPKYSAVAPSFSGLIVEFPSQKRTYKANKQKSVSFNETGQMRIYKRPANETKKSYSKKDYQRFVNDRNQDIIECSRILASKNGIKGLSADEKCFCTGLEYLLSPNIPKRMKKIQNERIMHVDLVLGEQESQSSHDAIGEVSKKSSYKARLRSFKVAMASAQLR